MTASRRQLLVGAAALSAAVITPERLWAAAAAQAAPWTLAVADVEDDLAPRPMRLVQGRPPAGLSGTLYRNGPARARRPGGSASHWFDGDGMVRRFHLSDGTATLSARFADTPKRRLETRLDAMVVPGFGTPPGPGVTLASPDDANAANTSVMLAGDRLWALWEGGSPLAMDPETLATEGFVTLRPDLRAMPFSAHPRTEPDGRIWNFGLGGRNAAIWRLSAAGALEAFELVALPRASFLHDFTMTERHLVLVLQPWLMEGSGLPITDRLAWRPERGTQVLVLDKADLSVRRLYEAPSFSFYHLSDAWEEADGTIRFAVCAYEEPTLGAEGGAAMLRGERPQGAPARLAFLALTPEGTTRFERSEVLAEFPRSDPRRAGRARDLTVYAGGDSAAGALPTGVGVWDHAAARARAFEFGEGHVVEEMLLVPRPGGSDERDAWLIGPTLNLQERATELHVFDVARVEAGPVCTWRADRPLPTGFHGAWRA